MKEMVRRILKIVALLIAIFIGIAILLSAVLYIPSVQDYIKREAEKAVSESLQLNLSVDKIRLKFPLILAVSDVSLSTMESDTIVSLKRLETKVLITPLLRKKISVPRLLLEDAHINYADTTSGLSAKADVGRLLVRRASMSLKTDAIRVGSFNLSEGDIALIIGESPPDTTESVAPAFNILLNRAVIERTHFNMQTNPEDIYLDVNLARGRIERVDVDMERQDIAVRSIQLKSGDYTFLTKSSTPDNAVVVSSAKSSEADVAVELDESIPWTISLKRLLIDDNSLHFGSLGSVKGSRGVFDPENIYITKLNLDVDSVYNRATDLTARVRKLSFREQSGLELTNLKGSVGLSDSQTYIRDFELTTPSSRMSLNALIGGSVIELSDDHSLNFTASATISTADAFRFFIPDDSLRVALRGKSLTLDGEADGTIGNIDLRKLNVSIPRHLRFSSRGKVRSVLHPNQLVANVRYSGSLDDIDFVKRLLPDTTLRERIAIPKPIKLGGNIGVAGQRYSPKLTLEADSGILELVADVNLRTEGYRVVASADQFPLNQFLPEDGLGLLDFNLQASGMGFDPTAVATEADVQMGVERFDFNGYNYSDLALNLTLNEHRLTGEILSGSEALKIDLGVDGVLEPNYYRAHIKGSVGDVDLQGMNFSEYPLEFSTVIDLDASIYPDSLYRAELDFNEIVVTHGIKTEHLNNIKVTASADQSKIESRLQSGDLLGKIDIPIGIDSLAKSISRTTEELMRQIDVRQIDMALVEPLLPPLTVEIVAHKDNPIHTYVRGQGVDFTRLRATISSGERPLRGGVTVNNLKTAGITLDTLSVGLGIKEHHLYYLTRLANRPGNIEQLALFYIYGKLEGDSASLNFYQRNRQQEVGFDVGFTAQLRDSSVRVTLPNLHPTLAYSRWSANEDNFVEYYFNKELYANLHLYSGEQKIDIASIEDEYLPEGSLSFNVSNVDMSQMLDFMPFPPNLQGYFSLSGVGGMRNDLMIGSLMTSFDDFHFNNQRVGNVKAIMGAAIDSLDVVTIGTRLILDSVTYVTIDGKYYEPTEEQEERLNVDAVIDRLPLKLVNPFVPNEMLKFSGVMEGDFKLSGTMAAPLMDGELKFTDVDIAMQLSGTTYKVSPEPISMTSNFLQFNNFGVIAPNKRPLSINGSVDFRNMSRPYADLSVDARNFKAVSSKYGSGAQLFGDVDLDLNVKVHGPFDAMVIRGGLKLLHTTNVTYQMRDTFLDVEDKEQTIVTFVSFDEEDEEEDEDIPVAGAFAIDVLVGVELEDGVRASVNLSEGGSNRAQLVGGGELTFSMNSQGDTRLSGRYTLSGGEVVYTPPLISTKRFNIAENSYVSWSGEIMDPTLSIKAIDRMTTTVTRAGGTQQETFDVAIVIENSLEDLSLYFDLSSPGELQSDIASLTQEERSSQAMSLLLYGTYSGPGATGKVDANNPLNDFIAREINEWTRNNFKGVDITVGLDDVDDAFGGSHIDYSYEVSKRLFSDRVKITIGGSLSDDKNPYTTSEDNFIEDIEIEYRLTKRDNMLLKAFRHNTKESILEGEVVETGGGFVLRKKVNSLREIFKVTPNLDRKLRREKRRMEKQEEKERKRAEKRRDD